MHPDLPFALQLEITTHCNLKCRMCPLNAGKTPSSLRPGHMTDVLWEEIVTIAREMDRVIISGFGEPLTHPQCMSFLQKLDSLGIRAGISTNGTLLTKSISEALAELQHLIHINISIDSPDPEIYHEIRGGQLEKALKGVENLMSVIDDPVKVTVSSVAMNSNIESLAAFPPLLSKLGVKKYILQGLVDLTPELQHEHLLHQKGVSEHFAKIKEACAEAGVELLFILPGRLNLELEDPSEALRKYYGQGALPKDWTRQCCVPWELPFVDKDGRIFPCCYAATRHTAIMGDLREESLEGIWYGEKYQEFRRNILDSRRTPAVCRDCTVVPLGKHPFRLYSAKILHEQSVLNDQVKLHLGIQNTGSRSWTQDDLVRVGTAHPRDHESAYAHPSWLSANRITSFMEKTVPPGGTATFDFRIRPTAEVRSEIFQLVVEEKCWLPNTQFEIRPGNAKENPLRFQGYKVGRRVIRMIRRLRRVVAGRKL
jgi:radical SAM protein with 4Fe4S-binding SPASM domain